MSVKGSLGCLEGADTGLGLLVSPYPHIRVVGSGLLDAGIDLVTGRDLLGLCRISLVDVTDLDHQDALLDLGEDPRLDSVKV